MKVHRILSTAVYILVAVGFPAHRAISQVETASVPPDVEVWYGSHQVFGQQGNPQRYINILGNVSDPDGVASLAYSLNGEPDSALSIGTDGRRLVSTGDFNIGILTSELVGGTNLVVITATDNVGDVARDTVTLDYAPGNIWPASFAIDWGTVTSIQGVAQVVDGLWRTEAGTVRTAVPGYDRLVAIGDTSWTDYQVTVPVTVHSVDYNSAPGVGVLLRWTGHTDDPVAGWQPKSGWNPFGAIAWIRWQNSTSVHLELYGTGVSTAYTPSLGTRYILKVRVETTVNSSGLYRLKIWEDGQPEPAAWHLQAERASLQKGSLMLIAHFADVSFGNVTVAPLPDTSPPPAPTGLTATPASDSRIDLVWRPCTDAESGITSYRLYRDGAAAGSTVDTSFRDTGLGAETSHTYEVSAVNGEGLESARSAPTGTTTLADMTPPTIESVAANGDSTRVIVVFGEPVEKTSSEAAVNYAIDHGVTVSTAAVGADSNIVMLTTSALMEGMMYTLSVSNVRDLAGNAIAPNTRAVFEFTDIQNEYPVDGNTIALYHFNGDLNDVGPNGLHLTAGGNAQLVSDNLGWMASPSGQALRVRGLGDKVAVYVPDRLIQPGSGASPLTIDAWIYPRAYRAYAVGNYPVVSLYQSWDARLEAIDGIWNSPPAPTVGVGDRTIVSSDVWESNVHPNAWHLLRIAFRTTGTAEVYVDNRLIGTGTVSLNSSRTGDWLLTLGNLDGDLDEVRISNAMPPTPPSAPVVLLAVPMSQSRIDLSWTAAEDPGSGIAFYRVYRNGAAVGTPTATAFSDTGLTAGTGYTYGVSAVNGAGLEGPRRSAALATTLPGVGALKPAFGGGLRFEVDQNYPNPFNPSTTIRYTLPEEAGVRLTIYNLFGQRVRVLVDAKQEAGMHRAVWDGRDASGRTVSTGLYFYRLEAGPHLAVRKMVLLK